MNEFVPPRVKFLPKAAPLYRALLPFAQTRHFLSAPPVGAHILLGASLRARHRWFFILALGGVRYEGTGLQHPPFYSARVVPPTAGAPSSGPAAPSIISSRGCAAVIGRFTACLCALMLEPHMAPVLQIQPRS